MGTEEIINKITSRDERKVWESSCEIISLGQKREKILPLIEYLEEIKLKTKCLDLGGEFAPNQRFVDFAIRIIEFHKMDERCPCALFSEEIKYECTNPNKEAEKGNVKIIDIAYMEDKWIDYYLVECLRCNQKFNVIEREGHYKWWEWTMI